jgi:hypothetical protein
MQSRYRHRLRIRSAVGDWVAACWPGDRHGTRRDQDSGHGAVPSTDRSADDSPECPASSRGGDEINCVPWEISRPAYQVVLEAAVGLLVVQAIIINRLTGVRYPFWARAPTPKIGTPASRGAFQRFTRFLWLD